MTTLINLSYSLSVNYVKAKKRKLNTLANNPPCSAKKKRLHADRIRSPASGTREISLQRPPTRSPRRWQHHRQTRFPTVVSLKYITSFQKVQTEMLICKLCTLRNFSLIKRIHSGREDIRSETPRFAFLIVFGNSGFAHG